MKTTKKSNSKTLLDHMFDQMAKLSAGAIDVDEAKAQAALAKQANNVLKYELERAATLAKYSEYFRQIEDE